jgi:nucleoid-associated protein YgaU
MSKSVSRFLLVFAVLFALGPASVLPTLSAHTPTFSADRPTPSHAPTLPELIRLSPFAAGAIKVKDAGTVAAKWKTRAGNAQGDYAAGVAAAAGDWEAKSAAAEDVYKAAVTDAASKGLYGRGVRGSAGKYQKNATTLGPQRFQQGVANATDAMAAGIAPVLQTIAGLTLPPRGVKGTNQERSNIVATALRKMKVGS